MLARLSKSVMQGFTNDQEGGFDLVFPAAACVSKRQGIIDRVLKQVFGWLQNRGARIHAGLRPRIRQQIVIPAGQVHSSPLWRRDRRSQGMGRSAALPCRHFVPATQALPRCTCSRAATPHFKDRPRRSSMSGSEVSASFRRLQNLSPCHAGCSGHPCQVCARS